MAILIANLGTSDISVKIDDYFLPLWDRSEPNISSENLTSLQQQSWNNRSSIICDRLCEELQVEKKINNRNQETFSFRKLIEKLLDCYRNDPNTWKTRLVFNRIIGILSEVKEDKIQKIYLFCTDQSTKEDPDFYELDTIYLYSLIKEYLSQENEYKDLELQLKLIPNIPDYQSSKDARKNTPLNEDLLLKYYYQEFQNIKETLGDEKILVSIKGGTPQMQNASKIQAISCFSHDKIIFVNPLLSVKGVLEGSPSEFEFSTYWKYARTQKYEIIQKLLERWDFDGAKVILDDWEKSLVALLDINIPPEEKEAINKNKDLIIEVSKVLDLANNYLNLAKDSQLSSFPNVAQFIQQIHNNYDTLLNLYSLCRIHWELNEVANFLTRLTSFCDEALLEIMLKLEFSGENGLSFYSGNAYLEREEVKHTDWWQEFENLEQSINSRVSVTPQYILRERVSKRNFITAVLKANKNAFPAWENVEECLNKLDYWVNLGSKLIHSAQGVSKVSMSTYLKDDLEKGEKDALKACDTEQILSELTKVAEAVFKLLERSPDSYQQYLFISTSNYYIYTEIKNWVIFSCHNIAVLT